jgi:hypothetical protein
MKIKSILAIASAFCFAIISFGCGGAATNTTVNAKPANTTTANSSTTTTTTTNTTTAPANTETAKADTSEPNTGVPECDEYIKKYEACLTKIAKTAPQVEGPMKQAFQAQRDGFKTAASTPQGKATLASTCKTAIETAKTSTKAYACEW